MAATIKEVAERAGCSITTVSRAFNNSSAVKSETLIRIKAAAEYYKYYPNTIARAMVKQRNHTIAFVVDEKHFPVYLNPFYAAISEAVREQAEKIGYNVYVVSSKSFTGDGAMLISNKKVDGLIIAGKCKKELLDRFYSQNAPMVLVNSEARGHDMVSITADDYQGTVMAVEHLIDQGHTKIGLVSGNLYSYISTIRRKAFFETMRKYDIPIQQEYILSTEADINSSLKNVKELLQLKDPPTALFCMNDVIAVGAIKAVIRWGLKVPEDMAIIGFDNSNICTFIEPELTSISIDTQKMGALSVNALDRIISGKPIENRRICLETMLVKRSST